MARAAEGGFSLLEAVVALAILAAAGMALFAAISQSIQMLSRAEAARGQDAALRDALAVIGQVNPMHTPRGEEPLGPFAMRWDSRLVEPELDGATGYLQPGLHRLGLYEVRIELLQGATTVREAVVRRAGYRQVREPPEL
jgi:general secretion pathway protein I